MSDSTNAEDARLNAIQAVNKAEQMAVGGLPQAWAKIAEAWASISRTYPETIEAVVSGELTCICPGTFPWNDPNCPACKSEGPVNTEETFQAWAVRQIEKHGAILQETMNRIDRLEAAGPSERIGRRIDTMREPRETQLSELEWRVIQELRAGRLVTHTPDYIAQLREAAPSDDQVVVSKDYIDELKTLATGRTSPDPINTPSKHDLMKAVVVNLIQGLTSRAVLVSPGDLRESEKVDIVAYPTQMSGQWQVRTQPRPV